MALSFFVLNDRTPQEMRQPSPIGALKPRLHAEPSIKRSRRAQQHRLPSLQRSAAWTAM